MDSFQCKYSMITVQHPFGGGRSFSKLRKYVEKARRARTKASVRLRRRERGDWGHVRASHLIGRSGPQFQQSDFFSSLLGSGVIRAVNFLKVFSCYVGVDLGRGDIRVPKHQLNGPQVCPMLQQVTCKGMAKGMG